MKEPTLGQVLGWFLEMFIILFLAVALFFIVEGIWKPAPVEEAFKFLEQLVALFGK